MKLLILAVSALLLGNCTREEKSKGQNHEDHAPSEEIKTAPLFVDLSTVDDLHPSLIGGTVQDPKDWLASPWVGNCSSTLVGSRVLKTAAHCVSNGGTKSFTIGTSRYTAKCTHHPSYRRNSTADWALCLVNGVVENVPFETFATAEEAQCGRGKQYLWTGYGCQRWGGGIDGKFRAGLVSTVSCPSGTNYDVVTRGSVALCSGDSGGGGYVVLPNGQRKVIGTNSRSNTTDTSYVSATFTPAFMSWAQGWAEANKVDICGITPDAKGCSGAKPEPEPEPEYPHPCSLDKRKNLLQELSQCLDLK